METNRDALGTPVRQGRAGASAITIRSAIAADAAAIVAIWNHEVLWTDTTTDTEPHSLEQQHRWLAERGDDHPVIVAAAGPIVVGFGALSPYRPKPAFGRTVEDSIYVASGHRGRGIGTLVLGRLLDLARERGHHTMLARITAGNRASIRLHAAQGFRLIGTERETAVKFGRWLDVALMQRAL
jgi:L-amino acid N-acyltransferase YncA